MRLTKRKLEVLRLIVDGKSNGQIGVILGISINTVAVHRASIMKKMGVHKTADLVVHAIRSSLVPVSLTHKLATIGGPESVQKQQRAHSGNE